MHLFMLQPVVRPVLDFIAAHVPSWLRIPKLSSLVPTRLKQKLSKGGSE